VKKFNTIIIIMFVVFIGFNMTAYTVAEDEVAVIKTLGKIDAVVIESSDQEQVQADLTAQGYHPNIMTTKGLHFKIPFIQTVNLYPSKYLTYTSTKETINTFDRRKIDIQMYAQYRIINPAFFNMTLQNKQKANSLMDDRVYPVVVQTANMLNFDDFFNKEKIAASIDHKKEQLNQELAAQYGIFVADIGIHRKNFPAANIASIEEKMTMEIQKESQKLMAEGDSQYQKDLSETERIKKEMVAKAVEEAATIKAQADAEVLEIHQKSLQKDLEFYRFIQRMNTYKTMKDTTVFMDKDNAFLRYLNGY
jgi:membrane protease subunit HflC